MYSKMQFFSSEILYLWLTSRYWKLYITEAVNLLQNPVSSLMNHYWKLRITETVNFLQNLVSLIDEPLLTTVYHWNSKSPPKSCIPELWAASDQQHLNEAIN